MKIKEYKNPVKCPNCKVGMDNGKQMYNRMMPISDKFIFRCPKCKKEWEVDYEENKNL